MILCCVIFKLKEERGKHKKRKGHIQEAWMRPFLSNIQSVYVFIILVDQ